MTAFSVGQPHSGVTSDVYVWCCEGCHCTHVRAGTTLLTFTPAEFADFAEAISRCYGQQRESGVLEEAPEETPETIIHSTATN